MHLLFAMKNYLKNKLAGYLVAMFFLGSAGGVFAQKKDNEGKDNLKKLLVEKFDTNLDKNLSPAEKLKAVAFLETVDENGDGQISLREHDAAITRLEKMEGLAKTKGTEKQTLSNRNASQRSVKWKKYMKSLPHGAGDRTFSGKVMPGEKGFDIKGLKRVDITLVKGAGVTQKQTTLAELDKVFAARAKRNATSQKKRSAAAKSLTKEDVAKVNAPVSYYDKAIILVKDGNHTVVPSGAVLNVPEKLLAMVSKKAVGALIGWPDFLKRYPRLVTTKDVSWSTVKGEDPITKKEKKLFEVGNKIVVAVFKGSPVTVLEPPVKEEEEGTAVVSDK